MRQHTLVGAGVADTQSSLDGYLRETGNYVTSVDFGGSAAYQSGRLGVDRIERLHRVVLLSFLFYVFVGTQFAANFGSAEFSGTAALAERLEGDPLNRIFVLALFGMSVPVVWHFRQATLECVRANKVLLGVVGFCALSVLWSNFPDLTLRRSFQLLVFTFTSIAIVAGTRNIRDLHGTLFHFLTAVSAVNLLMALVVPSSAFSDIGLKGIHSSKNMAGEIGMIAIVVGVTWVFGAQNRRAVMWGIAAIVLSTIFLALTLSKTSIVLAIVALLVGAVFYCVKRQGAWVAVVILTLCSTTASVAVGVLLWMDFDYMAIIQAVFGDASFSGRDELWAFARDAISKRPWLGYGYGAFWDVGEANDPLNRLDQGTWLGNVEKGVINQAHNGYLELPLHIGVPATIVAVLVVAGAMVNAARLAIRSSPVSGDGPFYAALVLCLFLNFPHNFTEATLFIRGTTLCQLCIYMALLANTLALRASAAATSAGRVAR